MSPQEIVHFAYVKGFERSDSEAVDIKIDLLKTDYYESWRKKRDIIFEDRVEVESPGLLPFNITPSNIGLIRAYGYRNDLIVKHLREFPDPPNLDQNEGIRAMRQTMTEACLYPPIFLTYPYLQDSFKVILFNEKVPTEWDKVSHYLNEHKYITNKEARIALGIASEVKMSKLFRGWLKKNIIIKMVRRIGEKRNVSYRLPTADEKGLFTQDKGK